MRPNSAKSPLRDSARLSIWFLWCLGFLFIPAVGIIVLQKLPAYGLSVRFLGEAASTVVGYLGAAGIFAIVGWLGARLWFAITRRSIYLPQAVPPPGAVAAPAPPSPGPPDPAAPASGEQVRCPKCGAAHPLAAQARFCHICGSPLAKATTPPEPVETPPTTEHSSPAAAATPAEPAAPERREGKSAGQFADLRPRLKAVLIDLPLLVGAFLVIYLTRVAPATGPGTTPIGLPELAALVVIGHAAILPPLLGGTPGQLRLGLRLVEPDGRRIGFPRAFVRALGLFLSAAPLGLGFLWINVDKRRQGWHDKLAGTYVVRREFVGLETGETVARPDLVATGLPQTQRSAGLALAVLLVLAVLLPYLAGQRYPDNRGMGPWQLWQVALGLGFDFGTPLKAWYSEPAVVALRASAGVGLVSFVCGLVGCLGVAMGRRGFGTPVAIGTAGLLVYVLVTALPMLAGISRTGYYSLGGPSTVFYPREGLFLFFLCGLGLTLLSVTLDTVPLLRRRRAARPPLVKAD